MRKKRFLAIVAAIAISISYVAPVTVFATETEEATDTTDDEQEEGEQTTIIAPGSESDDAADDGGNSGTGNSGGTGSTASSAKSSDSSLSHLSIAPGSLSPAFSSGTHEYTATVDAGVTSISVAARPNNGKAVIASVSGAKSLKPGTNTVKVVVEAENGATSTYTITVNCGSSTAAQTTTQGDTTSVEEDPVLEGEISAIDDDMEAEQKEKSEVKIDDNGYLVYEGNTYIPSSLMPEGEYVSLDKYNKLYEQAQMQKTKDMRLLIILVVVLVLLLIVILNLALKLRDIRQDIRLGLDKVDDDEEYTEKQTDTSMIPDVKIPEGIKPAKQEKRPSVEKAPQAEKAPRAEKAPKAEKTPKPVAQKPAKSAKSAKKAEDLEILDLNDL